MKFVDAHIHLSDEEYKECVDEIVTEARNSNVVALVSNSMDLETSIRTLRLAQQYPRMVYAALGVHPWSVNALTEEALRQTISFISEKGQGKELVAIGEIGLDHNYASIWDKQLAVFNDMLHLAEKFICQS
jgi:TatD DNase family protein